MGFLFFYAQTKVHLPRKQLSTQTVKREKQRPLLFRTSKKIVFFK
jgi:hypothetical protein